MISKKHIILLILIILLGNAYSTDIDSCQTISTPGNYVLIQNLTTSSTCIQISTDNVNLDCQGHTITGDGGYSDRGIYLYYSHSNNISNCIIDNFATNLRFYSSDNNRIENMTYQRDGGYDIYSDADSNNNYFDYIDFNTTDARAATDDQILPSYNSNLTTCGLINWPGISYKLISNVTTTGDCFFSYNGHTSLDCNGYTITGDGGYSDEGIYLYYSHSNNISNCIIDNFATNLRFYSSDNNRIENMTYQRDGGYDIYSDAGSNNNYFDYIDFNTTDARAATDDQILPSYNSNLTTCGLINWPGISYKLISNVTTTGDCFLSYNGHTNLDCNGYTITGDGGYSDRGIYLYYSHSNNISNCIIDNFATNLRFYSSDNNRIENMTYQRDGGYDIYSDADSNNNYFDYIDFNTTDARAATDDQILPSYNSNLTTCGLINWPGISYKLISNVTTTGDCFFSYNGHTNLDCNGYTITGDGGYSDRGIYLYYSHSNNISNCIIDNFATNLYLYSSDNNRIENMTYQRDDGYDIYSDAGSNNNYFDYIDFNTTDARAATDDQILPSYNSNLTTCGLINWPGISYKLISNVTTTGDCFLSYNGHTNLDCNGYTITGDGGYSDRGIYLLYSHSNNISNCIIDNFATNLYLSSSNNNRFFGNSFTNSTTYDVDISSSSNNHFYANNFSDSNKINTPAGNYFNTTNIGNYYTNFVCSETETRTYNEVDFEVCINPNNVTIDTSYYDYAPLTSWTSLIETLEEPEEPEEEIITETPKNLSFPAQDNFSQIISIIMLIAYFLL